MLNLLRKLLLPTPAPKRAPAPRALPAPRRVSEPLPDLPQPLIDIARRMHRLSGSKRSWAQLDDDERLALIVRGTGLTRDDIRARLAEGQRQELVDAAYANMLKALRALKSR